MTHLPSSIYFSAPARHEASKLRPVSVPYDQTAEFQEGNVFTSRSIGAALRAPPIERGGIESDRINLIITG
jgi:hypothetical protein